MDESGCRKRSHGSCDIVLQCVAVVCCSMLQKKSQRVLHCVAACCSSVAACCSSVLQCMAEGITGRVTRLIHVDTTHCLSVLHCVAVTCRSVLQCVAVMCCRRRHGASDMTRLT